VNKPIRVALVLVAFFWTIAAAAGSPQQIIPIVDLTPSFFAAIDPTTGSLAMRLERFKEDELYPNEELFDEPYFALSDPHLAWYFERLGSSRADLQSFTLSLKKELPRYEATFEGAFPKFDPQSLTIYLMPGFGSFDGMTRDIAGKHGLLIGVDNLEAERSTVPVFLTHELFHIYHHEINPTFFLTSSEDDLYRYGLYRELWAEGMATYVSQKLNPGTTLQQALFSKSLASLSPADTRKLACLLERALDSTNENDSALFFDGGVHPDGLPARGGYFIGYEIATQLGASRTLGELADLRGDDLRHDIGSGVRALCSAP